jgi:AmmeMemoRadiSam system protein A
MHLSCMLAMILAVAWPAASAGSGEKPMSYSEADQAMLFRIARESIEAHLQGKGPPPLGSDAPMLREPRGVFVTLHRKGRLRGCIGYLEAVKPLGQAVQEMARAAAFQDPRFPPLQAEELPEIDLEISILTRMRRIGAIEEITVGVHGLYLEQGPRRGLLLPQVAAEYGWDRLTFLRQTCTKAGLPQDAWKDGATRIFVFSAEILKEHQPTAGKPRQECPTP